MANNRRNASRSANFTERELDVIALLKQGMSNKRIGSQLKIRERTVEFHLSNIFRKLGVSSRGRAIAKLLAKRK